MRNVLRLGEALRLLSPDLAVGNAAAGFEAILEAEVTRLVVKRLGFASLGETDLELVSAVFGFLEAAKVGYAQFFFDLYGGRNLERLEAPYAGERWNSLREILGLYAKREVHPSYFDAVAPCDLLIEEIEKIWSHIAERDDFGPFEDKVAKIRLMGAALQT